MTVIAFIPFFVLSSVPYPSRSLNLVYVLYAVFEDLGGKQGQRYDLAVVLLSFILMGIHTGEYLTASVIWRLKGWEQLSRRGEAKSQERGAQRGPSLSRECAQQSGEDSAGQTAPKGNSNSVFSIVLWFYHI